MKLPALILILVASLTGCVVTVGEGEPGPAAAVDAPWPECETNPIAWNFLIQCPREDEILCRLGGKDVSRCTYKGQRCVDACTQQQQ